MNADQLTRWTAISWPAVLTAGLLLLALATACTLIARRLGGAVLTAGLGAMVCTGYSGDTSWRFARDRLGMVGHNERALMFAAGEIALLACAVMARANKKATAADSSAGTPGVPGVLVWCITGVQLVPAFAESGFWAGIVRGAIGPVMAALLWHLAMGLEIRVRRPDALSSGLPAQIGQELRERILSYLGLAVRGRTAAQVTRDRATARAVRLASRRWLGPWGRAALKASVARAAVGVSGEQRHQLLQLLAARRSADQLRTLDVASPWAPERAQEPHPATPLGVTGAELRRMHPMDAIQAVRDAHPDTTAPELASLCTEYGVTVTEGMVRIALHPKAVQPDAGGHPAILAVHPRRALATAEHPQPDAGTDFDAAAASALAVAQPTGPAPQQDALILDLAPMLPPHPEIVHRAAAAKADAQPAAPQASTPQPTSARPRPAVRAAATSRTVAQLRIPDADAEYLERALALNAKSLREDGQKAPLRLLQSELRIGQRRAQRIQAQLPDTPPASDERKAQ